MLVMPAIDLRGGRCVRLIQGRADQETVFSEDPPAMARRWVEEGAQFLHTVDLDGAFEGRPMHQELVTRVAQDISIPVQVGGGIRTRDDVAGYLENGVNRVIIGTRALESPDWIRELCEEFPQGIAVGIDAKNGMVAARGWQDVSEVSALDLADRLAGRPLAAVIFTDISKDGMMTGPNLESTRAMAEWVSVPVIASGGISTIEDVRAVAGLPVEGMIIGKALYTGAIRLPEAIRAARESEFRPPAPDPRSP